MGIWPLLIFAQSPKRSSTIALSVFREKTLPPKGIEKLSEAERQVFDWLIAGKSNWEISMILKKSTWTVKNQVKSIYLKLGVNNRVSAMRWFIDTESDEYSDSLPAATGHRREGVTQP